MSYTSAPLPTRTTIPSSRFSKSSRPSSYSQPSRHKNSSLYSSSYPYRSQKEYKNLKINFQDDKIKWVLYTTLMVILLFILASISILTGYTYFKLSKESNNLKQINLKSQKRIKSLQELFKNKLKEFDFYPECVEMQKTKVDNETWFSEFNEFENISNVQTKTYFEKLEEKKSLLTEQMKFDFFLQMSQAIEKINIVNSEEYLDKIYFHKWIQSNLLDANFKNLIFYHYNNCVKPHDFKPIENYNFQKLSPKFIEFFLRTQTISTALLLTKTENFEEKFYFNCEELIKSFYRIKRWMRIFENSLDMVNFINKIIPPNVVLIDFKPRHKASRFYFQKSRWIDISANVTKRAQNNIPTQDFDTLNFYLRKKKYIYFMLYEYFQLAFGDVIQ